MLARDNLEEHRRPLLVVEQSCAQGRAAERGASTTVRGHAEVLRIVRHWMSHGVRIFRVDNPHTKPLAFWEWLLAEVRRTDPDVLFLSEAFTRP